MRTRSSGSPTGRGEIAQITSLPLYPRIELTGVTQRVEEMRMLAQVIPCSKISGVTNSYADHANQMAIEGPTSRCCTSSPTRRHMGPHDPVVIPPVTTQVSHGAELAVVIVRLCKDVRAEPAGTANLGYTVANRWPAPSRSR